MLFHPSEVVDEALKHKKNMIALCIQEGIVITPDVSKALDLSAEAYAFQSLLRKKYYDMFVETIKKVREITKC